MLDEKLLSTDQVADYLGVSTRTVARLVQRGELPAFRVGRALRFKLADLEAYMEKHRISATGSHGVET